MQAGFGAGNGTRSPSLLGGTRLAHGRWGRQISHSTGNSPIFAVCLPPQVASDDSDLYTNTYIVYCRDLGDHQALLASAGAVNWGQSFCILGNLCPKASGRAPQQLNIYVLFGSTPGSHPTMTAPKLSSLDVSHADLLNETWSFGGNEKSRKYLATLIRHFPSICLLDAAGHPVSWIASYPFGAMGPGYTLHEHRRRGYMVMLINLLAKRLHALGYPSYGLVDVENYSMQRLQESQVTSPKSSLTWGLLPPAPQAFLSLAALYASLEVLS
uniref:Glycine N-acyltransferase-like protein n=1 Tax=Gopherus evgoodei TaxID=1825980 RepID=A0A8C4Y645_9SAUR